MPAAGQPDWRVQAGDLLAVYGRAQTVIDTEVAAVKRLLAATPADATQLRTARQAAVTRARELAAQVRGMRGAMLAVSDQFVREGLTAGYLAGAADTMALAGGTGPVTWTQEHLEAVNLLAKDTFDDLLNASVEARRTSERFARRVAELARQRIPASLLTGTTATQAGRQLAADLTQIAPVGITYRDGSVHKVGDYAEVVARTTTAVAYNVGGLTQARGLGVKWMEIIDGPKCGLSFHDDPTLADGMIVSYDTGLRYAISHPNCRRVLTPRPDITSEAEAKAAKRSTTAAQRADQLAADQARRAGQKARLTRQRAAGRALTRGQARGQAQGKAAAPPWQQPSAAGVSPDLLQKAHTYVQGLRAAPTSSLLREGTVDRLAAKLAGGSIDTPEGKAVRDRVNRDLVAWARTSGDTQAHSVKLQMAVQDVFGTSSDPFATWKGTPKARAAVEAEYAQEAAWYQQLVRTMYADTQEQLAKAGIRKVSLHRGMFDSLVGEGTPRWALEAKDAPGLVSHGMQQPATSWTTNPSVAVSFGMVQLRTTVPAGRVLSTVQTGFGTYREAEWVLIDGPGDLHAS